MERVTPVPRAFRRSTFRRRARAGAAAGRPFARRTLRRHLRERSHTRGRNRFDPRGAARAPKFGAMPRLREFDFGEWEGLRWDEIVATRPQLRERALTAAALYSPDGGETFAAVCERVALVFRRSARGTGGARRHRDARGSAPRGARGARPLAAKASALLRRVLRELPWKTASRG